MKYIIVSIAISSNKCFIFSLFSTQFHGNISKYSYTQCSTPFLFNFSKISFYLFFGEIARKNYRFLFFLRNCLAKESFSFQFLENFFLLFFPRNCLKMKSNIEIFDPPWQRKNEKIDIFFFFGNCLEEYSFSFQFLENFFYAFFIEIFQK